VTIPIHAAVAAIAAGGIQEAPFPALALGRAAPTWATVPVRGATIEGPADTIGPAIGVARAFGVALALAVRQAPATTTEVTSRAIS